ncbi:phosphopantetheine-binding protein [Microbacterium karelineae]|uniref:phosphopantetheine-binding protein n=1 Tax=Microbacterium karelineae TaxID=2654283 RepID=UPI0012E9D9A3|nr:phosphopantetheine-binding protein [Microbacterium karelineae]
MTRIDPAQITADIAETLGVPAAEVAPDDRLDDLGLDSIRTMELVERWRAAGIDIEFADLAAERDVAAWIAVLAR